MPVREVKNTITDALNALPDTVSRVLIRRLSYIGEQVVNAARTGGTYTDRTGNLRGSTGYVIARDGRIVSSSGFSPVKGAQTGPETGKSLAERLSSSTQGLVLIVVAGMRYAKYVAGRGYDVLDKAELLAQSLVPQMLKQLNLQ